MGLARLNLSLSWGTLRSGEIVIVIWYLKEDGLSPKRSVVLRYRSFNNRVDISTIILGILFSLFDGCLFCLEMHIRRVATNAILLILEAPGNPYA